jgi:NhaP-type Na+/H+ or K+/H+ antiporter
MVFVAAGAIVGPSMTGLLTFNVDNEVALVITEITLALVLFADASSLRLRMVRGDAWTPGRLLLIGLPLTMLLGAVLARGLFPDVGWVAAALIAVIVAPTDAALGMAVVTNRAVPRRIRRTLNVESGLNDGMAAPLVAVLVTVLLAEEEVDGGSAAAEAVGEIGLALVAAVIVGGVGGWALSHAQHRGWTSHLSEQLAIIGLALLSYELSTVIGGNGFIAAFVGGLLFGAATGQMLDMRVEFTETTAVMASYLVWTIFGAVFVGPVLAAGLVWQPILYATASLTVVRMVPVAISMIGSGFRLRTLLFLGWFGPRGLASVVFTLVAVETLGSGTLVSETVTTVVTWTVLLSVVAHGLTAQPLATAYGSYCAALLADTPEGMPVPDQRFRVRSLHEAHAHHR